MTVATHEQTIEQHVKANIECALEESGDYSSMAECRDAFMQNTRDQIEADGYTAEEAFDASNWFVNLFAQAAGVE